MRNFINFHPILYWLITVLTLGNFHSYQKGWEDGISRERLI